MIGDFNARTGNSADFIVNDSDNINIFQDFLPLDYDTDNCTLRNSMDKTTNSHGKELLNLCVSSRLRILNGRYLGDSLGHFTCYTTNGSSTVDYAIVNDSLQSSVKFFCTSELNYLSDHVQIYIVLKCKIDKFEEINIHNASLLKIGKSFKWNEQSKCKLINILNTEEVKNSIIDYETTNFECNENGVNLATTELTKIFENISKKVCKIKTCSKGKCKNKRKPWSDSDIRNFKSRINYIGKQLRNNPFDKSLKNIYFSTVKEFKKICKKKKYDYQQKLIENLFNCKSDDPQKFWKLLKSNYVNKKTNNFHLEIDHDQLKKHF